MTDKDKIRVKVLKTGVDYDLWKIRLQGALQWHSLSDVLEVDQASGSSDAPARDAATVAVDRAKASALIASALDEVSLRVVQKVYGNPAQMMAKPDERYNCKKTAAKISKMVELVSLHYTDRKDDISVHIDQMAGLLESIKGMGLSIDETMAIGILTSSVKVTKLAPVVAAIKTIVIL